MTHADDCKRKAEQAAARLAMFANERESEPTQTKRERHANAATAAQLRTLAESLRNTPPTSQADAAHIARGWKEHGKRNRSQAHTIAAEILAIGFEISGIVPPAIAQAYKDAGWQ